MAIPDPTKSEALFERFLSDNCIPFRRIEATKDRTPDYEITIGGKAVVVEVKELAKDANFARAEGSRTVGDHIRKKIEQAGSQLRRSSKDGKSTILLIYNKLDSMQLSGTEDHDLNDAMDGEHTVTLGGASRKIIDSFHGRNAKFRAKTNTSFSALGRLKLGNDHSIEVTLFENFYASVPLDYEALPGCFDKIGSIGLNT
jgi:hypothetical protein